MYVIKVRNRKGKNVLAEWKIEDLDYRLIEGQKVFETENDYVRILGAKEFVEHCNNNINEELKKDSPDFWRIFGSASAITNFINFENKGREGIKTPEKDFVVMFSREEYFVKASDYYFKENKYNSGEEEWAGTILHRKNSELEVLLTYE